MKSSRFFSQPALLAALVAAFLMLAINANSQVTRQIRSSGSTQIHNTTVGADSVGIQAQETDSAADAGDDDLGIDIPGAGGKTSLNRTIAPGTGHGPTVTSHAHAKSNPQVITSVDGLNFHDQRFANNGNQFSVVPPDQGLCAGNGFVVESVNDVLRVLDSNGNTLKTTDLNTFYGYAAAINRAVSPLTFGPEVTDPSCHFDSATQRWFQVALTLDRAVPTSQNLSGTNHLDIAVSQTADPTGQWTIFRLPVQDDGTQGTPDHHCVENTRSGPAHGPCLGDYPHIGMDANALYLTTNEFNLFANGFRGAQIYAISKQGLVSGGPANVVQFDTAALAPSLPYGIPGFTVWGAISPSAADFDADNGGTELFLSSLAVFSDTGAFNQLVQWNITNTQSINAPTPAVNLSAALVNTQTYAVPPNSAQKTGPFPLGQCLADTTIPVGTQTGCWRFFFASGGPFINPEEVLPSNDSRMQQVSLANGKLWAALDTDAPVNGQDQAGAAFFVINPIIRKVINQGTVAMSNNNLTYPAVGVTSSGRGVMAFTVVGNDHYPSAGYTSLDALAGAGDIHIVQEGAAPDDGFSAYFPEANPVRPRWGDYGAVAVDGDGSLWFASEYIAHSCDLNTYVATGFTCGGTRGSLGNWATRITHANVK
jgi:hypothetical protein